MTSKSPSAARGQSLRDQAPERAAGPPHHGDENALRSEPRRSKGPGQQASYPAESAARAEGLPEGKKGPPHRRRQRVATHAPRPVSTTPAVVGGARSASQLAAQRPPNAPAAAGGQEEAAKSPESKVFIYTYTIWNRSTSS